MSDIGEAVGGMVEGGLVARAIDPKTGMMKGTGEPGGNCLNCGAPITGAYCSACGQRAEVHRTISAFMHELLHGALHFEGKIWHTLPELVIHPGKLTRRYIDGQRARFVSPMALFLFAVFLMFAVFQAIGLTTPTNIDPGATGEQVQNGLKTAHSELDDNVKAAEDKLAAMAPDDPGRAAAEQDLENAKGALDGITLVEGAGLGADSKLTFKGTGIKAIDEGLIHKWRENPSLMLYKLQSNSYKFSWLLIPLSIPFVYAIFVTYSLAFMSLLFIVLSLLGKAGVSGGWLLLAGAVIPPVHIYKQLRGTYDLRRFSAFWRLGVLSAFIVIILGLFLQVLLLLGAF
jgi:hypothetical protein